MKPMWSTAFPESGKDIFTDYRPGWLPEGYEETSAMTVPGFTSIVYHDEMGNQIAFDYVSMQQGTGASVVPETAVLKVVKINDLHGELYLESDPAKASVLTWFDDETGLCFSLSTQLHESNILHIAESVSLS